jgi:hypothetical protein
LNSVGNSESLLRDLYVNFKGLLPDEGKRRLRLSKDQDLEQRRIKHERRLMAELQVSQTRAKADGGTAGEELFAKKKGIIFLTQGVWAELQADGGIAG